MRALMRLSAIGRGGDSVDDVSITVHQQTERRSHIVSTQNDILEAVAELVAARDRDKSYIEQTDVQYDGTAIKLPKGMTIPEAVENLERLDRYQRETIRVSESIDCFPQDGAVALSRVLRKRYGWATALPNPGFFGDSPPEMVPVEIGP